MPKHRYTEPGYTPTPAEIETYLQVLEFVSNRSFARMVELDPDTFPDDAAARRFISRVGEHYIGEIGDDLVESVENEDAAPAALHAMSTGLAFAALMCEFPLAQRFA